MYTNITKWFVEQTFDFLLGSYVDHIWHAHKAKSRISLVDTIDGKACCPINGMRGTSPHSPISWQTANVKNPCAIETCSYMYRIKRNIYIYIGICTQHVHPQCESWRAVVGFWHCSHGPAGFCRSSQDTLSYCLHILVEWYQCFCHGNHVPVAMLVRNAWSPQTSGKTIRIFCFIHALPTDWSTSGPWYHHINPRHRAFASVDITVPLSIRQILYIREKVINFPSMSSGDEVALLL